MRATSKSITIIGIDCATAAGNTGLARGHLEGGELTVDAVPERTTKMAALEETIRGWIAPRTLLAVDAPLGWPAAMADALGEHRAGLPLGSAESDANRLFRRATDRRVKAEIDQSPLEVGADRIARTAHTALAMLARLRRRTGLDLPLAWTPGELQGERSVIEVYPAATLRARGWPHKGYKSPSKAKADACRRVRETICERLAGEATFSAAARRAMLASDHFLDAALCVLAGADFMRGEVIRPNAGDLPRREGWIWVRPPGGSKRSADGADVPANTRAPDPSAT